MSSFVKGIIKLFVGLIGIAALFVGAYLAIALSSKEPLPPIAKDLDVSLAPRKAQPTSKAWVAFMTGKAPAKFSKKALAALKASLRTKDKKMRWYPDLAEAKKALETSAALRKMYVALLAEKGCPPRKPFTLPKDKSKRIKLFRLMPATHLIGLHSVALAQEGAADEAAKALVNALRGLLALEQRCPTNMIGTVIGLAQIGILRGYLRYIAIHPKLSLAAAAEIAKLLERMSQGKHNPMPNAMRYETEYILGALDSLSKAPKGNETRSVKMPLGRAWWPMWDPALTKTWIKRRGKADVHRASQPFGPGLWKEYPIQKRFKNVQKMGWKLYFRYNSVGLILLSIATPQFTKFFARWHQSRCLAAADLVLFSKHWQKDPAKAAAFSKTKVVNPLNGKPFGALGKGPVCVIHKLPKQVVALKGKALQLPPAPPAITTPTTPQDPAKRPTPRRK